MASDKMAALGFGCWWISLSTAWLIVLVGLGSMPPSRRATAIALCFCGRELRLARGTGHLRSQVVTLEVTPGFLSLGAVDIWGWMILLLWTGSASITGCVAATLTSTAQTPVALPPQL